MQFFFPLSPRVEGKKIACFLYQQVGVDGGILPAMLLDSANGEPCNAGSDGMQKTRQAKHLVWHNLPAHRWI